MSNITRAFCITFIATLLLGCHPKPKVHTLKTQVIHPTTLHKTLHFTGTIQPIHESSITSPADGTIDAVHYHYGQWVSKNTTVFTLNSPELQKLYHDTVTEYLKAKDSYTMAKTKFSGTEDLWNSGLLSKNNYLSEKSSLNTERVTLMQSTRKVTELLEKMGENSSADDELAGLSLSEFDKVRLALMSKHNLVQLKAPRRGILLYPPKSAGDKQAELTVGSTVKSGQVLALIGDMSGIRIDIDVPEIDMNVIQPGMPATIRGIAFGKHSFLGKLVAINAQASNKNNGLLPSFTAIVEIRHLDEQAQKIIKVGMSASIDLSIKSQDKLLVPIKSLKQDKNITTLTILNAKGKPEIRAVTTGAVEGESVVIESGLNAGETIQYEE